MTYKDILALAHAGYSADQIGKLAMLEQMPTPAAPATPVAPAAPAAPAPFDYQAMMAELLGIKNAIQTVNVQNSQQPEQPMTADQILANIIAPKPIKKED